MDKPVALITGASQGLGRAVAEALGAQGWRLVIDARRADRLDAAAARVRASAEVDADVVAVVGDVADPAHRAELVAAVERFGRLDVLVNNASTLGASPLPPLASLDLEVLRTTFEVNVVAPLALVQAVLPFLAASKGTVVNVTSDAAVEAYEGWGGYGSAKAALDHASRVLAAEHPEIAVYAVDPGDLRTAMHQAAFPGEDISDRPEPATVVPAFLRLLDARPASGRYRAAEFEPAVTS